jgi:hypothetical protein
VCFALIEFSLTGGCVEFGRYLPEAVDALATPVRPRRHATAVITSPATSESSDAAANISDSLDDAPYVFEEGADEDEGEEALIRDFDRDGAQGGEELLGFDHDGLEDDTEEEEWDLANNGEFRTVCKVLLTHLLDRSIQKVPDSYSRCGRSTV